jgi:hypothetical protein
MRYMMRFFGLAAAMCLTATATACTEEKDGIVIPISRSDEASFTNVSAALRAACATCHAASSARVFIATMDSSTLVASGLISPTTPGSSAILSKPRSAAHGGGIVSAFSTRDSALVAAWVSKLPAVDATMVTAVRTEFAPVIDGIGDALWLQGTPLTVPIAGGWAAANSVTARAMYDDGYLYMLLKWKDNQASYRRNPWVKKADGTWAVSAAKPAPENGDDWATYMTKHGGAAFDNEAAEYMYEDKVALIWNTYAAATTVPEFETVGCASACHDPTKGNKPGTTYNYSRNDLAAKKYLTVPGQILDMWHWKMQRMNINAQMDDQYVKAWVPVNDGTAANGGRATDGGSPSPYRENPATNSRPTFKSATQGYLPYTYSFSESDTLRMTDLEVAALPVGTMIANMITQRTNGSRGDVDAKGVFDAVTKTWTLEIRRRLVTGDGNDVQFDDLTRKYKWGVAVFDNAQIEHSISGTPMTLMFRRTP